MIFSVFCSLINLTDSSRIIRIVVTLRATAQIQYTVTQHQDAIYFVTIYIPKPTVP